MKFKLLSITFIFCLGLLVYSNTFYCSFHFDDESSITENFAIRNIHHLQYIWDFLPRRFLLYLSIALNYHFGGLNVLGYHLFNLAVHLGAAILVWWLVLLTFKTPAMREDKIARHADLIALCAGLIFVSHPIQTESVTYIVQRAASMAALFYLASLCFYIKSRLSDDKSVIARDKSVIASVAKQSFYICSLISAVAAMFTKETAATLPLMILLFEFGFFKRKKIIGDVCHLLPFLLTFFIIPVVMLFTETGARRLHELQSEPGISSAHYLLTQLRVMVTYVRLVFLPINQNLYYDYSISKSLFEWPVLMSLLFLITVIFIAERFFLKYRIISISIFWFFLTLLPESSIIPIKDVIFEHRLYLPMVGYSMFLAGGMYYLLEKGKSQHLAFRWLMIIVACYSILTYQRNKVWKDELTLWKDTVQKSPHITRPYNGLGLAHIQLGELDQALSDFNKAIALDPANAEAYNNRGNVLNKQGKSTQALSDFNESIRINPDVSGAFNNRGIAYSQQGNFTQALSDYNRAIQINPELAWVYYDRGILYSDQGDLSNALADYNMVLQIDPSIVNAYINRGIIFDEAGEFDRARSDYNMAIKINPNIAEAYFDRGNTYNQQGNYIQALFDYNKAIELNPRYVGAFYNRALVYSHLKEYNKARNDMEMVKKLGGDGK